MAADIVSQTGASPLQSIYPESLGDLRHLVRTCPIIDNHAHNLLRPEHLLDNEFLSITSEASGEALRDHVRSLPHLRAARQLRKLFGLAASATWDDILVKRREVLKTDRKGLIKKCLEGTHTILIDDGLGDSDTLETYDWHGQFTTAPCKRIVRVETVAADLLASMHEQGKLPAATAPGCDQAAAWSEFITAFKLSVATSLADDEVVGFKSVVCYRTGLDVLVGEDHELMETGRRSFCEHLVDGAARKFRIEHKGLNDALVVSTCKIIEAGFIQHGHTKPLQFHTGLGDNDISLLKSNPACLQPLIKAFPGVPFVLLHSSYPYTREAGYLATVYQNVYADIGEVFPMVSRDAQEQILRQALELTPTVKILWSTDGHFFPETYWLANLQMREVMEKVLCEYVEKEDLTVVQAMLAVKEILFENSNALYNLGLSLPASQKQDQQGQTRISLLSDNSHLTSSNMSYSNLEKEFVGWPFFLFQWLDYMGTLRGRWIPRREICSLKSISISKGNLGTLQNDLPTPVCDPVGSILVIPVVGSDRDMSIDPEDKHAASMLGYFAEPNGQPHPLCLRSFCKRQTELLAKAKLKVLVGFEVEVTFCSRSEDGSWQPLDRNGHAWGSLSDEQFTTVLDPLFRIVNGLAKMRIHVQQFHSEAGPGQYEFVLPPLPPVEAIDVLIQTRQYIQQHLATDKLRATFHAMPFPGVGTAAHAHISFNQDPKAAPVFTADQIQNHAFAAILEHLPALCAITMPEAESYRRVVENSWTGGTWVAWGTQNREVPLRRVSSDRFELRCIDGFANMYLAIGAVLALAVEGLSTRTGLSIRDCTVNPSKLSEKERAGLGIRTQIPRTIEEALEAFAQDTLLQRIISPEIARHYFVMKKAEQEMLGQKGNKERNDWLIERY